MTNVRASSSIRSKALARTLGAASRDFLQAYDQWQSTYPGFRDRLPDAQRARLDAFGQTLWRFDLRYRWATGVTALEFDDGIVSKASTAATKQGYFLLMRLVDVWFSLDLAFELYRSACVSSRVKHPSVLESLRKDSDRRLRAARAAAYDVGKDLRRRHRKPATQERFLAWARSLANASEPSTTTRLAGEAADLIQAHDPIGAHHLAAIACLVRNQYVHGGETASSRGFPAQEKVPVLRLLVGFTAIASLAMATEATTDMVKQIARHARFR